MIEEFALQCNNTIFISFLFSCHQAKYLIRVMTALTTSYTRSDFCCHLCPHNVFENFIRLSCRWCHNLSLLSWWMLNKVNIVTLNLMDCSCIDMDAQFCGAVWNIINTSMTSFLWAEKMPTLRTMIKVGDKYINITFFTGWHGRLSTRGNIVSKGGAEVDNAFQGVAIYHVIP